MSARTSDGEKDSPELRSYDRSNFVLGEYVHYVTMTGQLWNGPIGRARFVVRTPYRPWFLEFPSCFELISNREELEGFSRVNYFFQPNEAYSAALITSEEQRVIEAMRREEQRRAQRCYRCLDSPYPELVWVEGKLL